jgi:hypothetical protein
MPSRWKCASYSHSKQPQKSQDFKRILITVFVFTSAHRHNSHRRLMRSGCQDRLRLLSKTSHLSTFTSFTSFTTAHTGRARENFMRLITMHPPLRMRPRRSACARSCPSPSGLGRLAQRARREAPQLCCAPSHRARTLAQARYPSKQGHLLPPTRLRRPPRAPAPRAPLRGTPSLEPN